MKGNYFPRTHLKKLSSNQEDGRTPVRAVRHLTLETHNHLFDVSVDLRHIVTAFGRGALLV